MKKEKISGIYKILNKIDGKVYIGQSTDIDTRWGNHKKELKGNRHYNNHLQNSWNKYKEENFEFIIIDLCDDIDMLNYLEEKYISNYKACDQKYGYNIKLGGNNSKRTEFEKEHLREILSEIIGVNIYQLSLKGKLINTYNSFAEIGRKIEGISVHALISACNRCSIYKNYIWLREEDYLSNNYNINEIISSSRPKREDERVVQMTIDYDIIKLWDNTTQIENKLNIKKSYINEVCRGRRKSTNGYAWIRYEDYITGIKSKFKSKKVYKRVYQFNLYGELVKEWNSVLDIQEELNYDKFKIWGALSDSTYHPYEYYWSYNNKINDSIRVLRIVYQLDKKLKIIKKWKSIQSICNELKYDYSAVQRCCNDEQKTSYGYVWVYEENLNKVNNKVIRSDGKKVGLFKNNIIIKQWKSVKELSEEIGVKYITLVWRIKNNKINEDGTIYEIII